MLDIFLRSQLHSTKIRNMLSFWQKNARFLCNFCQKSCDCGGKFVILQHRLLAQVGEAGGLIYEKDVFGRLSLWVVNLASSYLYSRQMTTKRHVERIYIP